MADKNELELDQEALDKLMQGVSPGIQPWVEEEEELSAQMPEKEKPAEKAKTAKKAPHAKTTYSKDQLEGFLKAYDVYLKAPNNVQNHDLLKELDPNYESVHGDLFTDSVEKGSADIVAFADGYLDIDPDAIDSMQKYIENFGKEYNKGSYEYTPAAQKALDRLKDLRQQAQEKAKQQQAQKADTEKSKTTKIKELMKKKPQDRTLQDYLFLKEAIEQNPRRTPEQKAKDIESLTSQARTRMKEPNKVKDEELVVVPLFIDAFGYDKGHAINKDARSFRDAMAKRTPAVQNKTQDGIINEQPYNPGEAIQTSDNKKAQPQKEDKKKKKGGVFAWFGKAKDWVKKNAAPIIVGVLATAALLSGYGKKGAGDKDKKENKIENIAKTYDGGQLPEVTITPEHVDVNMLKQYGKRIAHQEKLSTEDAVKRTMSDLEAFKKLPDEMKAKFAGQSDEEKLAKLGVVRGDQDKLHKPIDSLLKGEKINPLTLKDISERTFKVTDDFGANKDNSLKNGKQSKDMSAYQFLKILNEKGMTGK